MHWSGPVPMWPLFIFASVQRQAQSEITRRYSTTCPHFWMCPALCAFHVQGDKLYGDALPICCQTEFGVRRRFIAGWVTTIRRRQFARKELGHPWRKVQDVWFGLVARSWLANGLDRKNANCIFEAYSLYLSWKVELFIWENQHGYPMQN